MLKQAIFIKSSASKEKVSFDVNRALTKEGRELCERRRHDITALMTESHTHNVVITSCSVRSAETEMLIYGNPEASRHHCAELYMPPFGSSDYGKIENILCSERHDDTSAYSYYADNEPLVFKRFKKRVKKKLSSILHDLPEAENLLVVQDSILMIPTAIAFTEILEARGGGCLVNLHGLGPCEGFVIKNMEKNKIITLEYIDG